MFCKKFLTRSRIFIVWGFLCLILAILISSLADFVIQIEALASLFPNRAAINFFHGFADGLSLVLIVLSLTLNLKAI